MSVKEASSLAVREIDAGGQVRARKLSHIVADRLRTQIAAGTLKFGDRLPSESALLEQLGISRPTLREALRVLESEGLIRLGRGARSGAIVLGPSIETAAQHGALYLVSHGTTLGEVHQVRMLLEPSLVSLLAGRAKKDFVRTLEYSVKTQVAALSAQDHVAAVRAINDFHGRMMEFSHNRALSLLVGMVRDFPTSVYSKLLLTGSARMRKVLQERTEKSTRSHDQLLKIIVGGKPNEAETFWRRYMEDTATFLARTKIGDLRVELQSWRY